MLLHPARFSTGPDVINLHGLAPKDRLLVARFSASDASYDSGVRATTDELVETICFMLGSAGPVVLSR